MTVAVALAPVVEHRPVTLADLVIGAVVETTDRCLAGDGVLADFVFFRMEPGHRGIVVPPWAAVREAGVQPYPIWHSVLERNPVWPFGQRVVRRWQSPIVAILWERFEKPYWSDALGELPALRLVTSGPKGAKSGCVLVDPETSRLRRYRPTEEAA